MITVGELINVIQKAEKEYGESIHDAHVYITIGNKDKLLGFDYCLSAEIVDNGQHLELTN